MAAATLTLEPTWVVPVWRAAESVEVLLGQSIHQWFPGYLHLKRQSMLQGTSVGVEPNFAELHDVLYVPGGPAKKPHLRPFWKGARNAHQEWMGENLAGSYAPSSIREAVQKVLDVDAQRRYVFKDDHAQLALETFLEGQRVPALPLAAFLFRDYGIASRLESDVATLIAIFKREYGYTGSATNEFDLLFDGSWQSSIDGPWLEQFVEPTAADAEP